ncbi:unnamed protein product [Lota lota]
MTPRLSVLECRGASSLFSPQRASLWGVAQRLLGTFSAGFKPLPQMGRTMSCDGGQVDLECRAPPVLQTYRRPCIPARSGTAGCLLSVSRELAASPGVRLHTHKLLKHSEKPPGRSEGSTRCYPFSIMFPVIALWNSVATCQRTQTLSDQEQPDGRRPLGAAVWTCWDMERGAVGLEEREL